MCDTKGVIYEGRTEDMNAVQGALSPRRPRRARWPKRMVGADVFFGLSQAGLRDAGNGAGMAPNPIIFALANPDPEIPYDVALAARPDAIVATGRSDYPNQVNNVLGFPFIFRGALDVRATTINDEMKLAATRGAGRAGQGRRARLACCAPTASTAWSSAASTSSPSRSIRAC